MIIRRVSGTIPITVSHPDPAPFVTDPAVLEMLRGVLSRRDVAAPPVAPLPSVFHGAVAGEKETEPFLDAAPGVALYHADALALLPRFAPESFDMVFADPPYFLSGGGMTCASGKRVSVNKGDWDTPTTLAGMHDFNRAWLQECYRLLKPDGTLFVTGTHHNIYSVGFALQELGYKILNDIAWFKINPPPNLSCRYFTHATETILWARKDTKTARHFYDYAAMKRDNNNKQMQSLWSIAPPKAHEKRHGKHPTQKPEALLDRIVRAATRPGDVVLDPFCGSGTTGVVCARLGRAFVGVEREAQYLEKAAARIKDEFAGGAVAALFVSLPAPVFAPEPAPTAATTWAERVTNALRTLGGEGHLRDINRALAQSPTLRATATWTCTVRRVVRESPRFLPVGKGRYRLQEAREQLALPV